MNINELREFLVKETRQHIASHPQLGLAIEDFETVLTALRDLMANSKIDHKIWLYGLLCYSEAMERTHGSKKENVRTDLG